MPAIRRTIPIRHSRASGTSAQCAERPEGQAQRLIQCLGLRHEPLDDQTFVCREPRLRGNDEAMRTSP